MLMNIVFDTPNTVSYIRIGLVVYAFNNFEHCFKFVAIYATSLIVSGVSHMLAKTYKLHTTYGSMLNMLIDRLTTCSLLVMLAHLYPSRKWLFNGLIILDVASHWCIVNSSAAIKLCDHRKTSDNPLLSMYYQIPFLLPMLVMFCEQFYLMYYIGYNMAGLWNMKEYIIMFHISGCICLAKQVIHIMQIKVSIMRYLKIDQDTLLNPTKPKKTN